MRLSATPQHPHAPSRLSLKLGRLRNMPDTSAGHLLVRIEGLHADDVPFLFERQPGRIGLSFLMSATFEFLVVILVIIAGRYASAPTAGPVHDRPDSRI